MHTPRARIACPEEFLTPATPDVIVSQRSDRFDVATVGATSAYQIEPDPARVDPGAHAKGILGHVIGVTELERRNLQQ